MSVGDMGGEVGGAGEAGRGGWLGSGALPRYLRQDLGVAGKRSAPACEDFAA